MTPGLLWLLAGVAACGAELVAPGVFLLWVGLAACGAGALTLALGLPFPGQIGAFAVLVAALLTVPLLLLRRRTVPAAMPGDELLGRECRAIAFEGSTGRVRLGDGSWLARVPDGVTPAAETLLRVVGREGTTLLVKPVDQ